MFKFLVLGLSLVMATPTKGKKTYLIETEDKNMTHNENRDYADYLEGMYVKLVVINAVSFPHRVHH